MKRFLRNIGIGLAVAVVLLGGAEWIAESIPNSYTYKRDYMEAHGGEIKTLILGSSNAYDGLNPSVLPAAFNLANSSQTLEDDYRLLARYIDTMDSLETVIVGLGYHSLGATTEDNRRTYYTIYMGLYPRWPINRHSLEVFDLRLLTKKIIKYAVSRDVTRCDSLGQRVGHTKAAAASGSEFWNKDAEALAAIDSQEWYKNTQNTPNAAINIDKEEKKNDIKNTESSTDTDRILTSINQQPVNEQDSFLASAQSCSTDIAAQSLSDDSDKNTKNNTLPIGNVECLQKCVVPTSENIKNNSTSSSHKYGSEVIARNVWYLREIIELCEGHGVKPVIVTMPARREYKEALPEEQIELHEAVMRDLPASAVYIDASDWGIAEEGWYNATHLTREASVEFTERVWEGKR